MIKEVGPQTTDFIKENVANMGMGEHFRHEPRGLIIVCYQHLISVLVADTEKCSGSVWIPIFDTFSIYTYNSYNILQ